MNKGQVRTVRSGALTRFVFLDGFVLQVTKHHLEPVRIVGTQHPKDRMREDENRIQKRERQRLKVSMI